MIEVCLRKGEHHRRALARDVLERDAAVPGPPVRRPSRNRPVRQLVESIYSKRSEQSKTACQRKPTHLPTALRPSRPVRQWVFHQAQTGIGNSPDPALSPAIEKVV